MPNKRDFKLSTGIALLGAILSVLLVIPSVGTSDTRIKKKDVDSLTKGTVWIEFSDFEKNKKGKVRLGSFMVVKPDTKVDGRRPPYIYFESAQRGSQSIVGTLEFDQLQTALEIHRSLIQAVSLAKSTGMKVTIKITGNNIWIGQLYGGSSLKSRFEESGFSINLEM